LRLRVRSGIPAWFVNGYLNLPSTQARLKSLATRGVSQSNISASKLKTFLVPLPPSPNREAFAAAAEAFSHTMVSARDRATAIDAAYEALLRTLMTGERRFSTFPVELQHDEAI